MKVLILCTANSARSQMGEGLLRHLAGDKLKVYSAGAKPTVVNPYAVRAMQARGIDISRQRSEHLALYVKTDFDYVITVCDAAADACPHFPGPARRLHWSFPDPAAVAGDDEEILESFVAVRNGLEAKLRRWLATAI